MDSRELAEWEAYERANGPLGNDYLHEALAQILDQVKLGNHLYGYKWKKNPVPAPERHIRPNDLYQAQFQEPKAEEDEMSPEQFAELMRNRQ